MKVFPGGVTGLTWKKAKGRQGINMAECAAAYEKWWKEWVEERQLLLLLQSFPGLSDRFGQPGHVCQAEVLWRIRNGELP